MILVSITEISCTSSSPKPQAQDIKLQDSSNEISDNTTNELAQALPTPLDPPDLYQNLNHYYNSAKKSFSNAIAPVSDKSQNSYLMVFNLCLGLIYTILMATSVFLIIIEPFKTKTSTGLSKDFLLIHLTGWLLLNVNDAYGLFGDSFYKNETHTSDFVLSSLVVLFMVAGLIVVNVIPCDPINKFSITVVVMCT